MSKDTGWKGFDVIYAYTRKQALADEVLIDVTETAIEAGVKVPCAVTSAVWWNYVKVPPGVVGQDEEGRLWDILSVFVWEAGKENNRDKDIMIFKVLVQQLSDGPPHEIDLKAVMGPGDEGEPVITIMLPIED